MIATRVRRRSPGTELGLRVLRPASPAPTGAGFRRSGPDRAGESRLASAPAPNFRSPRMCRRAARRNSLC